MEEIIDDLRELTVHCIISRYPNDTNALPYELYIKSKAHDLVKKARSVLEWVKLYLHRDLR